MEQLSEVVLASPIFIFTLLLLVSLTIPPIFERLRMPGLVGLLVAGVALGPYALALLTHESETMKLLSDIGKLYLMFVAGLEIDLGEFRKTRNRSFSFGLATFAVPLMTGTLIGLAFGFGTNSAVLIGSLLASHTLLAYPIVRRLGIVKTESVMVTVGATIFTDIGALLVLAVCVSIDAGEFSWLNLGLQLGALLAYAAVVLFGFDWAGKIYFRRSSDEEGNQFLFILLAVFLAAAGAQVIRVENIVGAFLAGLAVNDVLRGSPVKDKVEFVGSVLFIPFFFVDMGLLLNIPVFMETLTTNVLMVVAIVGGLVGSKFVAALITKLLFGYSRMEMLTMWSLSIPQVAATLAAALVGFQVGLLSEAIFNSVIVLMLVTSLVGPVLTARFASRLSMIQVPAPRPLPGMGQVLTLAHIPGTEVTPGPFTVVIPIHNPETEDYLIELAALLAHHEQGVIVPLVVVKASVFMDEPELDAAIAQNQRLLNRATDLGQQLKIEVRPTLRIDSDIAQGINRSAKETKANLIVMGYGEMTSLRARLFGNLANQVFWSSHCPVAVMRLLQPPTAIQHILVPLRDLTPSALRVARFAQFLAETNQATVTLLHVYAPQTPGEIRLEFKSQLMALLEMAEKPGLFKLKMVAHDDVAQVILRMADTFDLVILRSLRRRTVAGLAVSDVATQVMRDLECSIVLFGEASSDGFQR
ncbi:universal stress protein [Synechococcales cyanobacterium C]|uniref:Universal stress protein n=1 Tax=Petrachloros mirabilis ULC683 TaxID=2781853 RepID=A0A8K1ZYC7_9CYAN|nr:cation:proton antiporter [Petrachloros mirabilis]NCJ06107.1 universal stress protein [Petrachloros mirabilis ULC683]